MKEIMQEIITWIKNNCEWFFDGMGTEIVIIFCTVIIGVVGWLFKFLKKRDDNNCIENSIVLDNISGEKNITGNNNIINIYQSKGKEDSDKEKSLFSTRFIILKDLLNNARCYNEKEYTIEYISSLVGIKNVGEMKEYVDGNKEPDESIKQRFVDVFGVNRDWMLFNQGDYPFATNLKKYGDGTNIYDNVPMDILRHEKISEIQKFIIVIGEYEQRRSVLIIRKCSEYCYDIYPFVYDLDPNVGATGRRKLISFYRFLREANKLGKIYEIVYKATKEQFKDLYFGAVSPMSVRKYEIFKCFTDDFLDLTYAGSLRTDRIWDKDLLEVKRIIQADIKNVDAIDQEYDLKRIQSNLNKDENTVRLLSNKTDINEINEYVDECKKIIQEPTIIFEKSFVDLFIEKQISLYKLCNKELTILTEKFCEVIQDKITAFNREADKSLWNVSDRIQAYIEDGVIESGESIERVKYETQEYIGNEIKEYKSKNIIEISTVRKHITDIYECINSDI